jgi:hypothetical protein
MEGTSSRRYRRCGCVLDYGPISILVAILFSLATFAFEFHGSLPLKLVSIQAQNREACGEAETTLLF